MNHELMDYFIKKTDQRFDVIEKKLDEILRFKWRIAGALAVICFLVTVSFQVFFKVSGV